MGQDQTKGLKAGQDSLHQGLASQPQDLGVGSLLQGLGVQLEGHGHDSRDVVIP